MEFEFSSKRFIHAKQRPNHDIDLLFEARICSRVVHHKSGDLLVINAKSKGIPTSPSNASPCCVFISSQFSFESQRRAMSKNV